MTISRRSPRPERARDPVRTRGSLLAAGVRLFAERGYHGVSVDEIVGLAGCNKRMLYHYFGDKEGLYVEVLRAVYARMEASEMSPLPARGTTEQMIRKLIARHFEYLVRNPDFVKLLLWENLNEGRLLAKHPGLLSKAPVIERLQAILERGRERGDIAWSGDVRHLLVLMMGMCFIYCSNRYTLRQAVGLDVLRPRVRAEGLRLAQDAFLATIGLRSAGRPRRRPR
ncbi:MAG: TetR family transcriptional regulator [Planctomycetia bacterium]|nr:TetR family transcriptional regulator [Planctomycetia bacterium]